MTLSLDNSKGGDKRYTSRVVTDFVNNWWEDRPLPDTSRH